MERDMKLAEAAEGVAYHAEEFLSQLEKRWPEVCDMDEWRDALLQAISELRMLELATWQPISTAPKRMGFRILGWDGHEIVTVDYQPPYRYPEHIDHPAQWVQKSDSGRTTCYDITHWRPLPQPPAVC